MTPEFLQQVGAGVDEAFFIIGAIMFGLEIIKAVATGQLKGRAVLDMIASASTQIPYLLFEVFLMTSIYALFYFISTTLVTWTFELTAWTAVAAVLAADFIYYWEHRLAHQIRLFWTQHAVHHSSRYMNIIVGVRFGPLEGVLSAIMHLPLIFIGFSAEMVFFGILVVLAYQTWIHTELIGKLGPLDAVLNTPANHRVHHGCDDKYLDKNYGGILIIWDHLFRTYQREEETPNYGLKRDFDSVNPIAVWFSELPQFFRDLWKAVTFGELWARVAGRPGWRPEKKRNAPAQ